MSQIASFRTKLSTLTRYLDDPLVTEIAINGPGLIWLGKQGTRFMEPVAVPELTFSLLHALAELTASYTGQDTDRERPLLSATIPINLADGVDDTERGGYRIQVVLPPAVEERTIAICIRKPTLLDFSLDDYGAQGGFANVNEQSDDEQYSDDRLTELHKAGQWQEFLRGIVREHKPILISAGTNTGKTTFLNALLREIPECERIVVMEDAREVKLRQRNRLHLMFSRGEQSASKATPVELLEACMRLTPDWPIFGELRGAEAYPFLELINSGHPGMTTIHADSPRMVFDRLAQMVMRFGSPMTRDQIVDYARALIPVVVQLRRGSCGRRFISEIVYRNGR